jgi:hypothetical protein
MRSRRSHRPKRRGRARAAAAALFVAGVAAALGVAGWRICGPHGERCEETAWFPGYNVETGDIDLVMHDLNGNGIVDTWIYRNGRRIEEIEIDRNEDGTVDRLLVSDADGTLHLADAPSAP